MTPKTTSKTNKTPIPGVSLAYNLTARGAKRSRVKFNIELQTKLRRVKGLHEARKVHQETIEAEYKREMKSLLNCMQENNLKQIDLVGSKFYVLKKERADWTYSDELEDRIEDIDADKKKEQRKGIAINEPTEYTSVGHH